MGKKTKRRGNHQNARKQPERTVGNDPQFSILVKTLFGIVQCFHHIFILEGQLANGQHTTAFINKVKDLNNFVRPACSNANVKASIERVNESWAREIGRTLLEHYRVTSFELKHTAERLISSGLDGLKAKNIATSWAQRNYRKKLNKTVMDQFNVEINSLLNAAGTTLSQQQPPTPPSPKTYSQAVRSPGQVNSPPLRATPPRSQVARESPPPTPSLGRPLARGSSPKSRGSALQTRAKNLGPPSHSQANPTRESAPPKSRGTAPQTRALPHLFVANHTSHKEKDWDMPSIPDKVRTLVIGTSNIGRITSPVDDSVSLMSFPGAKFFHFATLFRNAKASCVYTHVEKVIFECGINERCNNAVKTTFPAFKRACNAARELFPNAQVFFVLPNWEATLKDEEQYNLDSFKKSVCQDKSGVVHHIPAIAPSQFVVTHDKIHWSPETANRLLAHWLGFVNTPAKN